MKIKNIKGLIKTLIATAIISMSMISTCFADDGIKNINDFCNKYMIVNNGLTSNDNHYISTANVDNTGTTTIKYQDGSWYSYNSSKMEYKFKPVESLTEINFASDSLLDKCRYDYDSIKNSDSDLILSDRNSCLKGFGKHSDKIYVNDLKTDEDLKSYANQWLKDNYNLTLDVPIGYSDIYGNIGGYNTITMDGKPLEIKINSKAKNIQLLSEKFLVHELTHYALCKQGKEYHDGTESFTTECTKNGSNTCEGKVGILHSHLQCTL
jgi:hypothetical protein